MRDTTHLVALLEGLSKEKARLSAARKPSEIAIRSVWVSQLESEVANEYKFLGMTPDSELPEMSDNELLVALSD